jgi:DNA repair ATPase RecN
MIEKFAGVLDTRGSEFLDLNHTNNTLILVSLMIPKFAPDLQRAWLDRSGGPEAAKLLERTGEAYDRWHRVAERLAAVTGYAQVRDERLDLLRFQAREIDAAQLRAGEDD